MEELRRHQVRCCGRSNWSAAERTIQTVAVSRRSQLPCPSTALQALLEAIDGARVDGVFCGDMQVSALLQACVPAGAAVPDGPRLLSCRCLAR